MTQLTEIATALASPFAIEEIGLLPKGKIERDGKTLCMAMPYADPRAYQDRLNKLAPGEWSTPAPLALTVGDKLICYVTVVICGVAHSDCGEAGPGENQGTEAWAQAFKRACSQFGLGRCLYDLDKAWVPYDAQRKRIDLDEAGCHHVVRQMYHKAGLSPHAQNDNGHHPPEELAATVKELQLEAKSLGLATTKEQWQALKRQVLGGNVANINLQSHQLAQLRGAIEAHKRGMAQPPSVA